MDLGLERAEWKCLWQVEKNQYCRWVLEKRFPTVPKFNDVVKLARRVYDCEPEGEDGEVACPRCNGVEFGECACIGTDQLTDEYGFPDLVAGGDPCQPHSTSCNAADSRQPSLAGEFLRIVDELRPRFVLRENPVTKFDANGSWYRFRGVLESLGYTVIPFRVRACCVGADIRRERVFLLAELQESQRKRPQGNVGEVLERESEGRQDSYIARPNRWYAAPRICGTADGIPNRVDRLRGVSNAVVPQVAELIGANLRRAIEEVSV